MLTLNSLNDLITALTARVNSIDGINLPSGTQGDIAELQACINGVSKDLKQSLLVIQQQLLNTNTLVNQYITLVNSKLGVS